MPIATLRLLYRHVNICKQGFLVCAILGVSQFRFINRATSSMYGYTLQMGSYSGVKVDPQDLFSDSQMGNIIYSYKIYLK